MQNYDWGSNTAFWRLLGRQMSGQPEAELWMGAHPKAPSMARLDSRSIALDRMIADDPVATIGLAALDVYGPALPFLFKVLALGKPASVQAHPIRARSVHGFEAEESAGVPLDAPHRSYKDRGDKPEIVVALEPMVILSGIRPLHDIEAALRAAGVPELAALADVQDAAEAIGKVLRATLMLDHVDGTRLHRRLVAAAPNMAEGEILQKLADDYPGDPAVIVALLLNLVKLRPEEALYTPPGRLHVLVSGAGIELMANSDNVLRAGLTSKYVDVDELLVASDLRPVAPALVVPELASPAERVYPAPAEEFGLSVIDLEVGGMFRSGRGPEILLLLGDHGHLRWPGGDLTLRRSGAVFVPASVTEFEAHGTGQLYRACVPGSSLRRS